MKQIFNTKNREMYTTGKLSGPLWSSVKIFFEFLRGFLFLKKYPPLAITVYGSARDCSLPQKYYKYAEEFGKLAAKKGYTVITGSGPGMMKAASKGAFEAGGNSLGISLNIEQEIPNMYLTNSLKFDYLYSRKAILAYAADSYVFMPGGFGTLDELTEILTLIKINKIPKVCVVLLGKEFWQPLYDFLCQDLAKKYKTIDDDVEKIVSLVETPEEAMEIVNKCIGEKNVNKNYYSS